MKRVFRIGGAVLLVAVLLAASVVVGGVAALGALDPVSIVIDGVPIDPAQLGVGHAAITIGAVLLAALLMVLVVPLAVLVPLGIVALLLVGAALVLAGAVALVFSPLIVLAGVGWLVWRALRPARTGPKADATIVG